MLFTLTNYQNENRVEMDAEEILGNGFIFPEGIDPYCSIDGLDDDGYWDGEKLILSAYDEEVFKYEAQPQPWLIKAMGL